LSINIYKVIVGGDGGVGKTTLTQRFLTGEFIADTKMTLGVGFFIHKVNIKDEEVTLQIWDLGGQEQFQSMGVFDKYVQGANGGILVFDLTHMKSFLSLSKWKELISNKSENVQLILVGTKADLVDEIKITESMITELIEELNINDYIETSSLTGKNVENVFKEIAKEIYNENMKKVKDILK